MSAINPNEFYIRSAIHEATFALRFDNLSSQYYIDATVKRINENRGSVIYNEPNISLNGKTLEKWIEEKNTRNDLFARIKKVANDSLVVTESSMLYVKT